jgi:asparagine synthase (glutamine-hydrolysing)
MCGIAGTVGWHGGAGLVDAMSAAEAHRGPDGHGRHDVVHGRVAVHLAHRRLSIIDVTDASAQPFVSGGLAITYNGELYNFRELRAELAAAGVRFRSAGDTEVVLEAWRRWGPASLGRLRGMFAFAVVEEATGRVVLARDQLGIKPLFYASRPDVDGSGSAWVFASELKAVVAALDEVRTDAAAMVAALAYTWIPEDRCAIEGVAKLGAGCWAEIDADGGLRVHRYFDPVDVAHEAAARPYPDLDAVLSDSVARHVVADVGVSTFLSGGLDSSLITVLAQRHVAGLDAYTIGFRPEDQRLEAMPDDLHYARKVAGRHGIRLHEITIEPDIVELWPRLAVALDEPIGDAAAINTVLICDAARAAGVKVLLSGMGADELFGGYRRHAATLLARRYQWIPGPVRHGLVAPVARRMPVAVGDRGIRSLRFAKRFLAFADLGEEAAFRQAMSLCSLDELGALVAPELSSAVAGVAADHARTYLRGAGLDPVNRMCLADVQMFLPALNLAYTDRASMHASTEVRVPFVDVEVMAAAFAIPGDRKIRGRQRKVALKDVAERHLDPEIVHRPKGLFSAPLRAWVRRDLTAMVDDLLPDGTLVASGFLQRDAVRSLIATDRAGRADNARQIWQLLTMELWHRHHTAAGARGLAGASASTRR